MKALIFIESPFQLIGAVEYCYKNKIDFNNSVLIINYQSKVSLLNKQIIANVLSFYDLKCAQTIELDEVITLKSMIARITFYREIFNQVSLPKFDVILVGEYRSLLGKHLINTLNLNSVILDDGNAIRRVPEERSNDITLREKIRIGVGKLFRLDINKPKSITYFSSILKSEDIDLKCEDTLLQNDFPRLKKLTRAQTSLNIRPTILIIGSPLSAAGVCSEEMEMKNTIAMIHFIQQLYTQNEYELVYIPHRREHQSKLETLKSLGCEINLDLLPIELKIAKFNVVECIGFYSTCFETLIEIFPDLSIKSIVFPQSDVFDEWQHFVDMQYQGYQRNTRIHVKHI